MNKNNSNLSFWGAGTPRTFRPIWVAEELGLMYEHHSIGPRTGETQTSEYTLLNPKQKIPYMADGEIKLSESVAMSRYLICRYGQQSTLFHPENLELQAKEDEWVSYIYGEIDETSLYVMRRHTDLKGIYGEAPAAVASAREYATKHLNVISAHIDGRQYVLGRFGLADVMLTSCLDWAVNYGLDVSEQLLTYRAGIAERDGYKKAFATNYANLIRG